MKKAINKNTGIRIAAILMALLMLLATCSIPVFAEELPGSALKISTAGGDRYIMQGNTGTIALKLENRMDTPITYDGIKVNLAKTSGLTVKVKDTGTVTLKEKGSTAEIRFDVTASKFCNTENVSYSFTLMNDGKEIYESRYFFFSVVEYSSTGSGSNVTGIEIDTDIEPADGFYVGGNNYLSVECFNATDVRLKNAIVSLTLPDGVGINSGSNSAELGYINSTDKKYCTFNLLVDKEATSGNKVFTITVTGQGKEGESLTFTKNFYYNVNAKEGKKEDPKDSEANPRIMVKDYSFGGTAVTAGSNFTLNLDLINTSKKNLYNAKVTLSADGSFVPVGGSNSYYIEEIDSKATDKHSVKLNVLPDAEQKVASITVAMSYEDKDGNQFTAEDVIAIKVNQITNLVIGEFLPPTEAYAGEQAYCEIKYFNMGKTTLSNLMVDVTGNFDLFETASDFVGNFVSGAEGSFSFYPVPTEEGTVEGSFIFSYNDVEGNQIVEEVPFAFEAMEYVEDEPWDMPEEPEEEGIPKSIIIAGIALAVLIIGFIVWRKIRKARINKKLELGDAAFELEHDSKKEAAKEDVTEEKKESK